MADRKLNVKITGDHSKLSAALDGANRKLDGFGGRIAGAGRVAAAGMAALGAGVGVVGVASFNLANDFDASMRQITGLVGIPKDEVDALRGSVLDLAGDTAKSPKELADALFSVTSAGFDGQEALQVLERASKAAAAGLGDTQAVALTVGAAVNAFGKENLSASEATDILVGTVKAGNLSAEELSGALGKILPIASSAGVGLDEVGASVALITRSGSTASEAVTQMKAALQAMNAPGNAAAKTLREAGLSTEDLQRTLSEDGLLSALRMVEDATGGNAVAMKEFFGSSEALSGALTILNGDASTVEGVFGDLANTAGLTDAAFESASENAGFKLQQAFSTLKAVGVQLGSALLPLVATLADKLSPHLEKLPGIIDGHVIPGVQRLAAIFTERVVPVLATVVGFVRDTLIPGWLQFADFMLTRVYPPVIQFGSRLIEILVPALQNVGQWVGKAVEWFQNLRGAFTGEGGGGGGLAGIAEAVGQKIGEIGPVVLAKLGELAVIAVEKLAELGKKFVEWVAPQIPPLLVELGKLLVDLGVWIGSTAVPALAEKLLEWGKALAEWVVPAIPGVIAELGKAVGELAAYIVVEGGGAILAAAKAMFGELLTGIVNVWSGTVWPWLRGLPRGIVVALSGLVGLLLPKGMDVLQSLMNGLIAKWPTITTYLAGLPAAMIRALGTVVNLLKSKGLQVLQSLLTGLSERWLTANHWLVGLGGRIVRAVGNLGGILVDAGKAAIRGFISGLRSIPVPNPASFIPGAGSLVGAVSSVGGIFGGLFPTGGIMPNRGLQVGDHRAALVQPGELILNRAQQQSVAAQLTAGNPVPVAAGGASTHLEMNFYGVTAEKLPEVVTQALIDYQRSTGRSIPIRVQEVR